MTIHNFIMASATIICHCKSLVQAVSNLNSVDSSAIQLQADAAVLTMSKSILIVWAPGHCGRPGNELTDHQVKLGAEDALGADNIDLYENKT